MTLPAILIASQSAEQFELAVRHELGDSVAISQVLEKSQMRQSYQAEPVILGRPDFVAELLDVRPPVSWVQSTWAGVTPLIKHSYRDYLLTGVKDVFGQQMAEYVLTHLLAHEGKLAQRSQSQQAKSWDGSLSGSVYGKTLGVMGTGSIGVEVGRICTQFGMQAVGLNTTGKPVPPFSSVYASDQLPAFLQGCDYVVAILPDLPETTNLLDAHAFACMKNSAVLINVGRGNVVDDDALVAALSKGELSAAILDVFKTEPLPDCSPLWEAPNLTVTGHIAAVSRPADIARVFTENYQRYCAGEPLNHVVDFDKGY